MHVNFFRQYSCSQGLRTICIALVLAGNSITAVPVHAQKDHLDSAISGFWEMHWDSMNTPPASLLPMTMQKRAEFYKKNQYARRWCNAVGMPALMATFRPIDIGVGTKQVVVASEVVPFPRHIYIDRKEHNNPDIYEPDVVGDSIGHWDGEDLVVDTIGFSEDGITELPGGGFRTKHSTLAERFHVINDGKNLVVTSTWYDPTVFAKPYTYSVTYYRVTTQPGLQPYSAGEMACDPQWPNHEQLMVEPTPVPMTIAKPPADRGQENITEEVTPAWNK